MNEVVDIDPKYWNQESGRWDTHAAFDTVGHQHVSHWAAGDGSDCDLMVVECRNGHFYIEDTWGEEAPGYADVFCVHNRHSRPVWMDQKHALDRARQIVSEVCGIQLREVAL